MLRDYGHSLLRLCPGLSIEAVVLTRHRRPAPDRSPTPCPAAPIKGAHNLLRLVVRSAILSHLKRGQFLPV